MRTLSVRLPEPLWQKLEEVEDKSEFVRGLLAQHFELGLLPPDQMEEIKRIVADEVRKQIAWHRLK